MGLPEEDKGPAWLRDWGTKTGYTDSDGLTGYVDSDALAVDIEDLIAFSGALKMEHEEDYRPHLREVFDLMSADPAGPDASFIELTESMKHHFDMLVHGSTTLAAHDEAVMRFVEAARTIGEEYRGADAMSAAKVTDVESTLGGTPPAPTETVVTPEQAAANVPDEPPSETDSPDDGKEY